MGLAGKASNAKEKLRHTASAAAGGQALGSTGSRGEMGGLGTLEGTLQSPFQQVLGGPQPVLVPSQAQLWPLPMPHRPLRDGNPCLLPPRAAFSGHG